MLSTIAAGGGNEVLRFVCLLRLGGGGGVWHRLFPLNLGSSWSIKVSKVVSPLILRFCRLCCVLAFLAYDRTLNIPACRILAFGLFAFQLEVELIGSPIFF